MPELTTGLFARDQFNKKEVIYMLKKYNSIYDNYVKTNPSPQNAHEVRYILDQLETNNIQFVDGYISGYYIVEPKTLKALDLDEFYAETHPNIVLSPTEYDDMIDNARKDPAKYFKLGQRKGLINNLTNLF